MNEFLSQKPIYVSDHKFTRLLGYLLFIFSVSVYAYSALYLIIGLIETIPSDQLLYVFAVSLGICWFGSIILIGKWFRYYQTYKPGFPSLIVSLIPLFILPLAWLMLQGIKMAEAAI